MCILILKLNINHISVDRETNFVVLENFRVKYLEKSIILCIYPMGMTPTKIKEQEEYIFKFVLK